MWTTAEIPLRTEIIEWAGYKYDPENNRYWRDHSRVLLMHHMKEGDETEDRWHAILWAELHQPNPVLCDVQGLGHLILICLALDGPMYPLIIKYPEP